MTDDLVQRLRRTYLKEYAPTGSMVGDISNRLRPFPILATELLFNPDGREAADAIEALQADKEKLREVLQRIAIATYNEARAGDKGYISRYGIHGIACAALDQTK